MSMSVTVAVTVEYPHGVRGELPDQGTQVGTHHQPPETDQRHTGENVSVYRSNIRQTYAIYTSLPTYVI